jgi:hypothetical protein
MNTNPTSNVNLQNNPLFITGKIGNKEIAKEDLSTFLAGIKDFEWTDNNIYKSAKVVEVKPTFLHTESTSSPHYQNKNINFDVFYLDQNPHLQNFEQYKSDIENRRTQIQDKIAQKNKEFIENFFSGENLSENPDKKELLEAIRKNKIKIIQNSNLNSKLGRFIGYLTQQQNAGMNYNFEFK